MTYNPNQLVGCITCNKDKSWKDVEHMVKHYAKDCFTVGHLIYCEEHKPEGAERLTIKW